MTTLEQTRTDEVVGFAADLIRIDTTNTGGHGTVGEALAAEYIADHLLAAGGRPEVLEAEPGRTNVILRIPGRHRGPGESATGVGNSRQGSGSSPTGAATADRGTVVHGHLDVVPAVSGEWTVDPFGGVVRDGFLWGRGAVDMKGTDAVMLAVARNWLTTGVRPEHDVVFAWLADEESGGRLGAQWLCRNHSELFRGCVTALGEVGGFSIPVGRANLYPVMTAERAHGHLQLTARNSSSHASIAAGANPILAVAAALAALAAHRFPATTSASVTGFLEKVGTLWRTDLTKMPLSEAISAIGPLGQLLAPAVRHSVVPTMVSGGYMPNVVPDEATATLDCRILPGRVDEFRDQIRELLPAGVEHVLTMLTDGMESPFDGDVVRAIHRALTRQDPAALPLPYMVSASTDAAHFSELGLVTYGFSPLKLPIGFHFGAMFHGPDERVPVDGLEFGVRVLDDLLRTL